MFAGSDLYDTALARICIVEWDMFDTALAHLKTANMGYIYIYNIYDLYDMYDLYDLYDMYDMYNVDHVLSDVWKCAKMCPHSTRKRAPFSPSA